LANTLICEFEEKIKNHPLFPRFWSRYVDDIFVIIDNNKVEELEKILNNEFPTIKFTFERENEGEIAFLDVLVSRKNILELKFSIYRKPTHTDRFITSDSFHCEQHKRATFNSMAFRLFNIPMEKEDFVREKNCISRIATINGFDNHFISKIINKHKKNFEMKNFTTLLKIESDKKKKFISVPYFPLITNKLNESFKKHDIKLVQRSKFTIKNSLANNKFKSRNKLHESGIYREHCKTCDYKYIGQSKRRIFERHKEHVGAIKNYQKGTSAVADHMHSFKIKHELDENKFELLKKVNCEKKLNGWESLYISNINQKLMNKDPPPISSYLFGYIGKMN